MKYFNITILLLLVFAVHIAIATLSQNYSIQDDADSYVTIAHNLIEGYGYVFQPGELPTAWRAPGYPVFLALIWSVFGESILLAMYANAFLWMLTTFIAYRFAIVTIGKKYSLIAAGCIGLYPSFLGMTGLIWSESLYILLFMSLHLCLLSLNKKSSLWICLLCGILLGCSILTRSTTIVMLPIILFIGWLNCFRITGQQACIVLVIGLSIMGSWTVRNYIIHQSPILVESNVGFNMYVGNRADTPIPFSWKKLDTARSDPEYSLLTDGLNEAEADKILRSEAIAQMKIAPLRTITMMFTKVFDFWLPDFFVARNVSSGTYGPAYQPFWLGVLAITATAYIIIIICAFKYLFRNIYQVHTIYTVMVVILYTAPHALIYGASRYHLPLMPLLIILAAPILLELYKGNKLSK